MYSISKFNGRNSGLQIVTKSSYDMCIPVAAVAVVSSKSPKRSSRANASSWEASCAKNFPESRTNSSSASSKVWIFFSTVPTWILDRRARGEPEFGGDSLRLSFAPVGGGVTFARCAGLRCYNRPVQYCCTDVFTCDFFAAPLAGAAVSLAVGPAGLHLVLQLVFATAALTSQVVAAAFLFGLL